jgi:uncharacterized protein YbjT (DUF2867 family)
MKVTVFGATGAIGKLTVDELLERGHTVTAHARNARKIPESGAGLVNTVVGELTDIGLVDDAAR